MGFAVRADRDRDDAAKSSRRQHLVLLHPIKSFPKSSASTASQAAAMDRSVEAPAQAPMAVPAEVKQLPTAPRLPLGLKLLVGVQQGSTVITGGLVATALVVYSWTVYLDKMVSRSFQDLETLKASIQQVTTANATLKNSMAEQAESPAAGFKPFEPERAIFLSTAEKRPSVEPDLTPEVHAPMSHPLGY